MAHPKSGAIALESPQWKSLSSAISAVILAALFIIAGVWKITDPYAAAERMAQAKVPYALSIPAALGFGIAETFAGVLILVPRFRRWGAWLTGILLVAFLAYMAIFYNALRGEECNCFPWIKRVVGPGFFIGDLVMLLLAVVAGAWAKTTGSRRSALMILAAVAVFAGVSFGVNAARQGSIRAPATITVDGKPFQLHQGRVFLYFFDPECSHCDAAARMMSQWNWDDTKVIGVPTVRPEFGVQFMTETGLRAPLTSDAELLRKTFTFNDPPYGVALERGHQKAAFNQFDEREPAQGLKKLGFIR